jgi:hypothetical protein
MAKASHNFNFGIDLSGVKLDDVVHDYIDELMNKQFATQEQELQKAVAKESSWSNLLSKQDVTYQDYVKQYYEYWDSIDKNKYYEELEINPTEEDYIVKEIQNTPPIAQGHCPWDLSFLEEPEYKSRAKDVNSWRELWTKLDENIDPCQAAADNYLLFGIANNLFVTVIPRYYPEESEIRTAGVLLEATPGQIEDRVKEVERLRTEDPTLKLEVFNRKADTAYRVLVEKLDVSFREYVHLACGGELRHGMDLRNNPLYSGTRRVAWAQWYFIFERYGVTALEQMSALFRKKGGFNGGYGGEKWANGSDILLARERGELGPDEFTNKQIFVDRVFTLEHNGGCFLNKLGWSNHRKERKGFSQPFNNMKNNVLRAHCANPVDVQTLYNYASEDVQKLLVEYLDFAQQSSLEINGIWGQNTEAMPVKNVTKNPDQTEFGWVDWSKEIPLATPSKSIESYMQQVQPLTISDLGFLSTYQNPWKAKDKVLPINKTPAKPVFIELTEHDTIYNINVDELGDVSHWLIPEKAVYEFDYINYYSVHCNLVKNTSTFQFCLIDTFEAHHYDVNITMPGIYEPSTIDPQIVPWQYAQAVLDYVESNKW